MVVCALEFNTSAQLWVLQRARAMGARTIMNAAPAPTDPLEDTMKDILACVDVLVVNETEAEVLLGEGGSVKTVEEAKAACKRLISQIGKARKQPV